LFDSGKKAPQTRHFEPMYLFIGIGIERQRFFARLKAADALTEKEFLGES